MTSTTSSRGGLRRCNDPSTDLDDVYVVCEHLQRAILEILHQWLKLVDDFDSADFGEAKIEFQENVFRPLLETEENLEWLGAFVRGTIDRCTISESRLSELLVINTRQLRLQKIFAFIATQANDELENCLELASRGIVGLSVNDALTEQVRIFAGELQNELSC